MIFSDRNHSHTGCCTLEGQEVKRADAATRIVCLHQVVGAGAQELLSYRGIPAWCTSEKVGTTVSEMEAAAAARRVVLPRD